MSRLALNTGLDLYVRPPLDTVSTIRCGLPSTTWPARLADDASVRTVVLHGEGKSFCSGLDIASFMSGQGGTGMLLERDSDRLANFAQRVAYDWSLVPAPVIAAIHGNCFGGGLQIALGTDIRIASPDAKLSIMEVKWGLVPDMGITQTLPRLVPIDVERG